MRTGRRWTTVLATLMLIVAVVPALGVALLEARDIAKPIPLVDVAYALSFAFFPAVGWLIAVRLPRNPLGWIYLAFSTVALIAFALEGLAPLQAHEGNDSAAVALMQVGGWVYGLSITLVLLPGVLLFPDGRLPGHRWLLVLWGGASLMLLNLVLQLFGPSTVCVEPIWEGGVLTRCALRADNPLRVAVVESLNTSLGGAVDPLLALLVLLSLVSLFVRYRRSTRDVRQQIKWVVFVAATGIVPLILLSGARQLFGFSGVEVLDTLLLIALTIALPVAIGVAILKYRLYDIDRIISRTAAYAIVAGVLGAVFVGSVALTQQLLPVEGQLGIVVSTLMVAALFNPLRLRVQNAVDRRFNRSRYDARRVVEEFAGHLRDDVDLDLMQGALLRAAEETMQPTYISLWTREQKKESP